LNHIKHIKNDWRKARKNYVPSTTASETVVQKIYPLKYIYSEQDQRLPGNSIFQSCLGDSIIQPCPKFILVDLFALSYNIQLSP